MDLVIIEEMKELFILFIIKEIKFVINGMIN